MTKLSTLSPPVYILEVLDGATRQAMDTKEIQIRKEEVKEFFTDDISIHRRP